MTKGLGKALFLVLLLTVFSVGSAYADGSPGFRLRIADVTSGLETVITGVVTDGAGTISFTNDIGNAGFSIVATRSKSADGFGGEILTLSSRVVYGGTGQVRITVEDGNYLPPDTAALFSAALGGFSSGVPTATGHTQAGDSATFQSLINLVNPAGSLSAFGNPVGAQFGSNAAISGGSGADFSFGTSTSYQIVSVATLNFVSGGVADFTLTSTLGRSTGGPLTGIDIASVPEPSSLLLLGAGLFGLAIARRKMGTAV